ncbi:MAG: hypothetical protein U1F30_04475 [Steroidobacteraceae bacterium]
MALDLRHRLPLALLSLLLGRRSLPEPVRRDEPYDVLGALLCALTFGLCFAGLESPCTAIRR